MIVDKFDRENFFCDLQRILILEDAVCPVLGSQSHQKENSGFVLNSLR